MRRAHTAHVSGDTREGPMRLHILSASLVAAWAAWSSGLAAPAPVPNAGPTHPRVLPPGPCDPATQSGTQSHGGGGGAGKIIVQGGKTGDSQGIIVQGGKT